MRQETKEILDEIMKQWSEDKLYVLANINNEDMENFVIVKNKKGLSDNSGQQKPNKEDIICKITVPINIKKAYIYFRGSYSIDNDFEDVYEYIKNFLAIITSK
ncbi:unnamed protein product, partial [marine sediment metagenome]